MQVCSLEQYGVPIWSPSSLTRDLLVFRADLIVYLGYWNMDWVT